MLQGLLDQLKTQISAELTGKAGVKQGEIPAIMDVIGAVAGKKLGMEVAAGNLGALMNLFSNEPNTAEASGVQTSLTNSLVSALSEKLGIGKEKAMQITKVVVPHLISLISKKNAETPASDSSALSSLFGGDSAGALGQAKEKLGGFFK